MKHFKAMGEIIRCKIGMVLACCGVTLLTGLASEEGSSAEVPGEAWKQEIFSDTHTHKKQSRATSTSAVEALVSSCDALHIFCHAGFGGLAFLAREAGQPRT